MSKTAVKQKQNPDPSLKFSVICARKDMIKALAAILPAVERHNTIPILGGVSFEIETGCIRLTASNMDQWLGASIVADADHPAKFVCLEPHGLAALLKLLDEDDVALTYNAAQMELTVAAGAVEGTLRTLPWEDFPEWPRKATPIDLHFGGDQLIRAIDRVSYAISTEETRYYLNGVYLHARDGKPWMAATDGHRLALTIVEPDLSPPRDEPHHYPGVPVYGVIIPRPTIAMVKTFAQRGAVDIGLGESSLEIEQADASNAEGIGYTLYSKLIDGTFPDYQRVIPSGNGQHCVLAPAIITPAISRARTLCKTKSLALKIIVDAQEVTLQMRDVEGGRISETIELPEPATQRFEHGVNGKYLAEVLGSFDGAVRYCWADPASPITIYSADVPPGPQGVYLHTEASHMVVLMPMRV